MTTPYSIDLYTNDLSRGVCRHPAPSYAYTCPNRNLYTVCYLGLPSPSMSSLIAFE